MPHYLLCNNDGLVISYVECPEHDAGNQLFDGAGHIIQIEAGKVPDFIRNDVFVDLSTGNEIQSTPKQITVDPITVGRDVKRQRNKLLLSSDWTQVADAPVDKTAWAAYRQALRDIPQQEGFPENVVWPQQP